MWSLDQFRFDEGINASQVLLYDDQAGQTKPMSLTEALRIARSRDTNIVAERPDNDEFPACNLSRVTLPLRWERLPDGDDPEPVDERLWFEGSCGERDFLVEGEGHSFRGRMSAWCPHLRRSYRVSLSEMEPMSEEASYFVRGYLSGSEPNPPTDGDGNTTPEDLLAWRSATKRFRRTGSWYGRWGTCQTCGCVLLPDSGDQRCAEHSTDEEL